MDKVEAAWTLFVKKPIIFMFPFDAEAPDVLDFIHAKVSSSAFEADLHWSEYCATVTPPQVPSPCAVFPPPPLGGRVLPPGPVVPAFWAGVVSQVNCHQLPPRGLLKPSVSIPKLTKSQATRAMTNPARV